jgi:RHS repeat-associated protein
MRLALLWGRRSLLMLVAATMAAAMIFAVAVRATSAQAAGAGQESAAVRSELSHLAPSSGPVVSNAPASGIQGAPPVIAGKIIPKYSTSTATTYQLPDGMMVTRVYASPTTSDGMEGGVSPLVAGYSPSCTLSSTAPTTSSCDEATMLAGYNSATKTTNRALLGFNMPKLSDDAQLIGAQLAVYVGSSTTSTPVAMGAYRVSTEWSAGATWDTTNGTTAWYTPGGDFSTGSDAAINPSVGASKGWAYWYPEQTVQEWYNGPDAPSGEGASNFGLLLKDVTEGSTNNDLTFEIPAEGEHRPAITFYWANRGIGQQPQFTTLPVVHSGQMSIEANVASGNLQINNQDLKVAGTGLNFEVNRTWGSLESEDEDNYGYGWSGNKWPISISEGYNGALYFHSEEGVFSSFHKNGTNYTAPEGLHATLCGTESEKPCTALPKGVSYRLTYDQSQVHYDFNAAGWLLDEQDRYGNTISTPPEIGEANGQEETTDTQGRKFLNQWNKTAEPDQIWIEELTDKSGVRSTKYYYEVGADKHRHLTAYKDADGHETKYGYTGDLLTRITTPGGRVIKFEYDSENRIKEIVQTDNSEHTTGPSTTFTYYPLGSGKPTGCATSQKATVVKDPDGNDGKAGHTTTYCANVKDEIEKTLDASGNSTETSYNPLGNVTSTTAAAPGNGESGDVESLGYDESGLNLMCVVAGTSSKSTSCPSRPDKSGLLTSYSYKDKANPFSSTQVENPEGHSTFGCYNHGEQEESEGHKCPTSEAEQPAGSLQNENDPLASENELKFAYNKNGTVKSSTDADGHTTTYEYDEKGNLKKITPPTGSGISATTITVDADSRPHVITDGAGHIETITYDKDDRITEIAYTGTGTARTVKFEYDADGNLIKREDPTGTTKYTVDPLNRVTKEELPGSLSNSYEYDDASNMTAFTDGGGTTKYKYNGLNELESMLEPGATKETKFTYDNDHGLDEITYASGAIEKYKLEPTTGRPETVTAEDVTGTTVPKLTYAYKEGENDTGLIESLTESTGNTTSYVYDKLNRLTEAKTAGTNPSFYKYTLDGAGNRKQQTVNPTKDEEAGGKTIYYVLNSGNELECRQTVTGACSKNSSTELSAYTYDGAGEETAITPKSDTSGTTFAYNAARETGSITPSGSGASALSYGGTGQNDLTAVGSTTTLQNSLLGITREVSSTGTSYFARTPTGLLIDERTPSGDFNPLYDGQGDVIGLVSSTGKVERTFRYGPYGENTKSEGTQTIPYPFGYKGGYRMPGGNKGEGNVANGLYHFGQRYYDPTTGRWTQQDPSSHVGNTSQGDYFLFTGDDPINQADPSGEFSLFFPSRATCYTIAFLCAVTNSGETYVKIAEEVIDDSVTVVYEGIEDGIEIDEEL